MVRVLSKIERLIFKLGYCKGIGIRGKWKIAVYVENYHHHGLTIKEMVRIAEVRQHAEVFKKSWRELSDVWIDEQIGKQQFITWQDSDYPCIFHHIDHPPLILFYSGTIDLLHSKKIAVVGARDISAYGKKVVWKLVPKLIEENWVTVSGMAKGVDQLSHEVSIHSGGSTIGVVGCGLDLCYPKEVAYLFVEMRKNHLLLSEYPQGIPVKRHHFPMRNRIIAALSQGVCVIEAKERSGSLITAQLALEYGKDVFAVPGEILTGQSNGCHRLIQDGAKCIVSPKDIIEELPKTAVLF